MTQSQHLIKRKLSILELSKTMGNISEACRKLGVSRQHYYDINSAFEEDGMALLRILTDRGTEYYGRIETHPYQLFLHLTGVKHSKTKVRHPQTNRSTERLNQIIQNEYYKLAFRKKIYKSIDEIEADLDIFMDDYNNERTNQGKYCQGRTPMQTFQDGKALYQQYIFEKLEEGKEAA